MKKGQVLQKSQTYLLIKVPPKYGFREKIEVGLPSLRQQNDIDLFEIKVRNGRQNLIFYTLKCIKIDQLRKKTVSKLHLMEDKIY
jgi:hypothetical protein